MLEAGTSNASPGVCRSLAVRRGTHRVVPDHTWVLLSRGISALNLFRWFALANLCVVVMGVERGFVELWWWQQLGGLCSPATAAATTAPSTGYFKTLCG